MNDEYDFAQDLTFCDRAPNPRVDTVVAVIANEEVFMWAEADGLMATVLAFVRCKGDPVAVLIINARSDAVKGGHPVEFGPVQESERQHVAINDDAILAELNSFARKADDSFGADDRQVGMTKLDDVAASWGTYLKQCYTRIGQPEIVGSLINQERPANSDRRRCG